MGEIVTFYSYKGGTGRTMAVANCGYLLAVEPEPRDVVLIDWDLEAPGLPRYFHNLVQASFPQDSRGEQFDAHPGLVDVYKELRDIAGRHPATESGAFAALDEVDLDRYLIPTDVPHLSLMKAGGQGEDYARDVATFDWEELHRLSPWLFRAFTARLAQRFDYVLIDSRTGLTDTAGICTSIIPETLVVVFTPNRQSLLGALEVTRRALRYRRDSDDLRALRVLPLPSRIEASEPVLRDVWRFGDAQSRIPGYQQSFESLFASAYGLPSCSLNEYFAEVQIQHVPRFAYGEELAPMVESGDRLSLTRSIENFVRRFRSGVAAWEDESEAESSGASPQDKRNEENDAWVRECRSAAKPALDALGLKGWMEAAFFPSMTPTQLRAAGPKFLLQSATAAQLPGVGWPIGAVLTTPNGRPRPRTDGIEATIVDKSLPSYDYWFISERGSFYLLRSLEEVSEYLLVNDRVERAVELLLYCQRLYSFLGLSPDSLIRVVVRFSGLSGRALGTRVPDHPESFNWLAGTPTSDELDVDLTFPLNAGPATILSSARLITRPLFANHNFFELPATDYDRIVASRFGDSALFTPSAHRAMR